jgi:hypothetical protein
MKKSLFPLAMTIAAFAVTGCEEPITCDEGNKAVLTVYNYTICTPTIEVDGDVVAEDLTATLLEDVPGDSVVIELDEGSHTISAELSFISFCEEDETTIDAVCGGIYTWEFR